MNLSVILIINLAYHFISNEVELFNIYTIVIICLAAIIVIITTFSSIFKKEKYLYREKLFVLAEITSFLIVTSYIVSSLKNDTLIKITGTVLQNRNLQVVLVIICLIYFSEKFIIYRYFNGIKTESIYLVCASVLNYAIVLNCAFIPLYIMNEIKYAVIFLMIQVLLISLKFWLKNKKNKNSNCNDIELYKTREKQLVHLCETIENIDHENYAIALNGEWGSGKSVMIDAFRKRSEEQGNYCIYINPLVSDTQENLIKKFKRDLGILMKKMGYMLDETVPLKNIS
ncbi:MAG: hypothetical protein COA82_00935 [Alkaliphilus sp.]|nr:MAG: hypothetical protein COA82_00935 [Alkaliphilus sp.]